jgi:ketosteroid isomerase-like protein
MAGADTEHDVQTPDQRLVAPYLDYVTAFNAADLHSVARHLAEDVFFDWGDVMPALVGRHAFLDFYRTAWQHFDEELTVSDIRTEGDLLSAHLSTRIDIHTDWPDCPIRPMYAGTGFTVSGRMRYRFRGGLIRHIADDVDTSSTTT